LKTKPFAFGRETAKCSRYAKIKVDKKHNRKFQVLMNVFGMKLDWSSISWGECKNLFFSGLVAQETSHKGQ